MSGFAASSMGQMVSLFCVDLCTIDFLRASGTLDKIFEITPFFSLVAVPIGESLQTMVEHHVDTF